LGEALHLRVNSKAPEDSHPMQRKQCCSSGGDDTLESSRLQGKRPGPIGFV
jgi:hypothetical protein